MGKLSLCKVCFMSWALMLMHSTAEPIYFFHNYSLTWAQARNHCQVCFKDLVTVSHNSTYILTKNLTSDYWIGLRKYFFPSYDFTNDTGMAWSHWANGDPLAFQNWYPGWPVFKSPFSKISCCSCSCTCPAVTPPLPTSFTTYTAPNVSRFTVTPDNMVNMSNFHNFSDFNATDLSQPTVPSPLVSITAAPAAPTAPTTPRLPVEAACVKTPMLFPNPDENYIEDSCVAMLSNGAWVEKNCTDLLPFICYEDRFYGTVNVSNVTASSAVLTWLPGPDEISSYRLEVRNSTGDKVLTENMSLNLNYILGNLSAGFKYTVTVFAVKCDRDIDNPQNVNFYTIPNKVENLTVTMQTTTSIHLRWNKPDGNVDLYRVWYMNTEKTTKTNGTFDGLTVDGLTPGTLYTFSVWSGVNDSSKWSVRSDITVYTKPDKVSNLIVLGNTNISLRLNWTAPRGGFTGYNVTAFSNIAGSMALGMAMLLCVKKLFDTVLNQSQTSCEVKELPPGTEITLTVTVLLNNTLEGDAVTVVSYTAPRPISNLSLVTTESSLNASWTYSAESYSSFMVVVQFDGQNSTHNTTSLWKNVTGLKTAAYYTVTVYSVNGNLKGPGVTGSNFTLPLPPTNPMVESKNKNQITFSWTAPSNASTATYTVSLSSSFWGQKWTSLTNKTSWTFGGLTSGTKYQFEVATLAGNLTSIPVTITQSTDAQPMQISLSMLCSSATPLLCARSNTQDDIYKQLNKTFGDLLGDSVTWLLNKQISENLAP